MDRESNPPFFVAFAGLPGSGKSTLAESLAAATGAPAFANDWLMGSLKPLGVFRQLDEPTAQAIPYNLVETLVVRQLRLGLSAITDCVVSEEIGTRWKGIAEEYGATFSVVECVCSDIELHRSRVETRVRGIPGWHEIDWDHVQAMRAKFPPLEVEKLVVDAVNPVEHNVQTVLDHLARASEPVQ